MWVVLLIKLSYNLMQFFFFLLTFVGSVIRPKVVRSVHYCPATQKTIERKYADLTNFDVIPSVNMYPTKDDDGNLLETEYGLSKYRDSQTLTIQEMPEKAPTGKSEILFILKINKKLE
jgi:DNA replicative helicase MCM subunit Mcm2 (Cdc46/Mcm family)